MSILISSTSLHPFSHQFTPLKLNFLSLHQNSLYQRWSDLHIIHTVINSHFSSSVIHWQHQNHWYFVFLEILYSRVQEYLFLFHLSHVLFIVFLSFSFAEALSSHWSLNFGETQSSILRPLLYTYSLSNIFQLHDLNTLYILIILDLSSSILYHQLPMWHFHLDVWVRLYCNKKKHENACGLKQQCLFLIYTSCQGISKRSTYCSYSWTMADGSSIFSPVFMIRVKKKREDGKSCMLILEAFTENKYMSHLFTSQALPIWYITHLTIYRLVFHFSLL